MLKHLRPPIFANALRPHARECQVPASLRRSVAPSLLVRSSGDCRPNGYYDWTPGGEGGNPPESRRPERHGARHALGALILLAVTVAVWGLLFAAGLLFVAFGK